MSMMNDYTFQILAKQRHDDLIAEAANDRLVRTATSGPSELAPAGPRGSTAQGRCADATPRGRPRSTEQPTHRG